jgi:hypothetical protein
MTYPKKDQLAHTMKVELNYHLWRALIPILAKEWTVLKPPLDGTRRKRFRIASPRHMSMPMMIDATDDDGNLFTLKVQIFARATNERIKI